MSALLGIALGGVVAIAGVLQFKSNAGEWPVLNESHLGLIHFRRYRQKFFWCFNSYVRCPSVLIALRVSFSVPCSGSRLTVKPSLIGTLLRKERLVKSYWIALLTHLLFSMGSGAYLIYTLFKSSDATVNECLRRSGEPDSTLNKVACEGAMVALKGVTIGIWVVILLLELCEFATGFRRSISFLTHVQGDASLFAATFGSSGRRTTRQTSRDLRPRRSHRSCGWLSKKRFC